MCTNFYDNFLPDFIIFPSLFFPFHLLSCEAANFFLSFFCEMEKREMRERTQDKIHNGGIFTFSKKNKFKKYIFIVVERDSFIASVGMETSFFFHKIQETHKNSPKIFIFRSICVHVCVYSGNFGFWKVIAFLWKK